MESQQVGGVWSPTNQNEIVSLSYDGTLNILDTRQEDGPSRKLYGRESNAYDSVGWLKLKL